MSTGPSGNIPILTDAKAQLDALNDAAKQAKKTIKDLEKELNKAIKLGGLADPTKLGIAQAKLSAIDAKKAQVEAMIEAVKKSKELRHEIVESLNKSKDFAEKVGGVVRSQLVQNLVYGGEIKAGDVGNFLEKVAARIPGVYGKIAQMIAGGASAGLQAATDQRDIQGAYGRGEISRQELALTEASRYDANGINVSGLRNLASKFGLIQDQAQRDQELLGEAKEFGALSNLGRNRLNELYRQQGVKGDAGELLNRIHKQENLLEKQLGRGLTDEERAKAARAGAAEEIEKGGIAEADVVRIINAEKIRNERRPPPPVINMQTRREWEQASIRQSIRRVPFKIKD